MQYDHKSTSKPDVRSLHGACDGLSRPQYIVGYELDYIGPQYLKIDVSIESRGV